MRLKLAKRAFLIGAHQSAIAGDIGREDRSQPPFEGRLSHKNCHYPLRFPIEFVIETATHIDM